jgi:5-methylcytosine-specific restriction endonuclease McrA
MPNAPPRACPRCGALVAGGGRCPRCARQADHARGTAQQRGYDAAWARYSKAWLARFPWCGMRQNGQLFAEHSQCVQLGLRTQATVTDHIKAMKDGGAKFDPANHQSLCGNCNRRKNIRFEGGFGR